MILHSKIFSLISYSIIQFNQLFLYYLLGILIGSFISVFLKQPIKKAAITLSTKRIPNLLKISLASILGILSPLCLYGTVPLVASLNESGVEEEFLISFMMSSILLNPQLIIYSASLGSTVLIIRIISCFMCGILSGLLVKLFYKDKLFLNFKKFHETKNKDTDSNRFIRYIKNVGRNVKATGLYFLVGILLSALFQVFVPADIIENLFGDSGFGVLMAATIGVPLYACGGGTIPLLRTWLFSGMSLGSAAAFMITGPATKITNLGALKIVLGSKSFVLYLLYIICFACVTGLFVNLIL